MALKHAHKLMTLYTQQLATLNKHRGKGQQNVTVEHGNVQVGGRAIVGNVAPGAGKAAPPSPEALGHKEMPVLKATPEKVKTRKRKS